MDSRCTYIIGFDILDNDQLRDAIVQTLLKDLKAEKINQSCYKTNSNKNVVEMQDWLSKKCKECATISGEFNSEDFVKLYCSAYLSDCKTEHKHEMYEYVIDLKNK
jgi:hypothetical protein